MAKNEWKESLIQYIPELGLSLAKYSGEQLIDRVGEDILKNVVSSILCGRNVRALTEGLTQRRISLSNAAMLIAYLKASKNIKDFQNRLPQLVSNELKVSKLKSRTKSISTIACRFDRKKCSKCFA